MINKLVESVEKVNGGHTVARCSTVQIDNHVLVHNQLVKGREDIARGQRRREVRGRGGERQREREKEKGRERQRERERDRESSHVRYDKRVMFTRTLR